MALDGSSAQTAAVSGKQLIADNPGLPSGVYWLDPDGAGAASPFQAYVNMTINDGGWVLAAHSVPSSPLANFTLTQAFSVSPTPNSVQSGQLNLSAIELDATDSVMIYADGTIVGTYAYGSHVAVAAAQRDLGKTIDIYFKESSGNDTLIGGSGADTLTGGAGDDTLFGGDGTDVAVFSGNKADYSFSSSVSALTVSGSDGVDRLVGIETLRFADGDVTVTRDGEFRVNTTTADHQYRPTMAALAGGGFVVTWESYDQDGSGWGVYGQRYGADGAAVGSEFRVNTTTVDHQLSPTVAALADGGFVVTWEFSNQDGSSGGIYGQRYDAAGAAASPEFPINPMMADSQSTPTVATLADGGFVVVWTYAGSLHGIYGQHYDADGVAIGPEFCVNTTMTSGYVSPMVAALAGGGFVVTWTSDNQDGVGCAIRGQRYGADGVAIGTEFSINTMKVDGLYPPTMAALADGGFVVTWRSYNQDGSWGDIYGQRCDADGDAIGTEFRINTTTAYQQGSPSVAALADGGFVVTWTSGSNQDSSDVYGQRYGADGAAVGTEFCVNTTTAGAHIFPTVAVLTGGGFVVTWTSLDWDGYGVYGQCYDAGGNAVGAVSLTGGAGADTLVGGDGIAMILGGDGADWLQGSPLTTLVGGMGDDTYVVADARTVLLETSGQGTDTVRTDLGAYTLADHFEGLTFTGTGAFVGTGNGLDNTLTGGAGNDTLNGGSGADTLIGGAGNDVYVVDSANDVVVEATVLGGAVDAGGTDTVQASVTWTLGNFVENLTLTGASNINGTGNALSNLLIGNVARNVLNGGAGDDTLNGGSGADTLFGGAGNDVYVVDNTNDMVVEATVLGGAVDAGGTDTVQASVTWTLGNLVEKLTLTGSASINGTGNSLANVITGNSGANILNGGAGDDTLIGGSGADVAVFSGNKADYTVSFSASALTVSGSDGVDLLADIETLRFADGDVTVTRDGEFRVNTETAENQSASAMEALPGGGFVVTWTSFNQDGSNGGVYAQRYGADGAAVGPEFRVNTATAGDQISPTVAALAGGGFVVTWESHPPEGQGHGIYGQRYGADGAAIGPEFRVNATTAESEGSPTVAALAGGGFVVTWELFSQDDWTWRVYARRYDADGAAIGPEFRVNTTTGSVSSHTVAALADDGFVVTWSSADGSNYGIYGQRYGADGAAIGPDFRVNTTTADLQSYSTVAALAGGGFVVSWTSSNQDGSGWGIYGQRYGADGAAVGPEFRVNTTTDSDQSFSAVAALAGGGFVITWASFDQDGSRGGIYGQRYGADGAAVGPEFRINATTADNQSFPTAAALAGGGFVVTWMSNLQDGSGYGVYGQRYDADGNAVGQISLTGSAGADTLVGGDGIDMILAGGGADWLRGGPLTTLAGGMGDDTYVVTDARTVLVENANQGTDAVRTSLGAYTLADHIEGLTFTGTGAFVGKGNGLDNILIGGGGADTLVGGAGDDTLIGGAGGDWLEGGSGNDVFVVTGTETEVVEQINDGVDTVQSDVSFGLGRNLENLTLGGSAAVVGVGNKRDNVLIGNAANNVLTGKKGNDTLFGGGGTDLLVGGDDNDILIGGAGADTLSGGSGLDVFRYASASEGGDLIVDFETGEDKLAFYSPNFGNLADGALSGSAFVLNGVATQSLATFLFNTTTHALSFDADGNGAGVAVNIATFGTRVTLSASDILVVNTNLV